VLKKQILNFIANKQKVELYKEEMQYIQKHLLVSNDVEMIEITGQSRFFNAYIEIVSKETEEVITTETGNFLKEKLNYLKRHMGVFIYMESSWFEIVGVDAVSLEVDDLFGNYDVMVGLRLQKKWEPVIRSVLKQELGDEEKFDLMFSNEDGLWDLNFDLNAVEGFSENMSLEDAYQVIYQFLFQLVELIEESKDR
jgi:hypothetical protein